MLQLDHTTAVLLARRKLQRREIRKHRQTMAAVFTCAALVCLVALFVAPLIGAAMAGVDVLNMPFWSAHGTTINQALDTITRAIS